jgi:hypothetical protein
MSSDIDPQEFGALQAQVGMLVSAVEKLDGKVDTIHDKLTEAKGGWKVLMGLGGASSVLGGLVTWFATHFIGKGPSA